jgi:predicted phosphodiesterase
MVVFQFASDLHIEYNKNSWDDFITPVADYLILAGDIGSLYLMEDLVNFLNYFCPKFKKVFYIPGNHEYYPVKNIKPVEMSELNRRLMSINIQNLIILNNRSFVYKNICIIGSTLWTHIPENNTLPDSCVKIKGITKENYNDMHSSGLQYIKKMLHYCKTANKIPLIITHHCPTFKVFPTNIHLDKYSCLYATNLDYILTNPFHTWICGHIHHNFNLLLENGARIIGNQFGKPRDCIKDYKRNAIITITE